MATNPVQEYPAKAVITVKVVISPVKAISLVKVVTNPAKVINPVRVAIVPVTIATDKATPQEVVPEAATVPVPPAIILMLNTA